MKTLQSYIKKSDAFKAFAKNRKCNIEVEGLDGFPLFQCAHLMADNVDGITWMICPTEEVARVLFSNSALVSGVPVLMLPTSGRVLYSAWEGSSKEYEQIRCLGNILNAGNALVITSLRAICSPVPRRSAIEKASLTFKVGQNLDTMEIAQTLADGNYFRSPNTTMPGEFTIRGEVLDVFPYGAELPLRVYLDWDRIERICRFEPLSQQVTKELGHVSFPIMEASGESPLDCGGISQYFNEKDYFILVGDKRLESSYKSMQLEAKSLYRHAYQQDRSATRPDEILFDWDAFCREVKGSVTVLDISGQSSVSYRFDIDGPRSYFGNFTFFKQELEGLTSDRWDINIFVSTEVQRQRLETMLSDFSDITYKVGNLSGGFSIRSERFIVFCESEIFGRKKQVVKTLQHTQGRRRTFSLLPRHHGDPAQFAVPKTEAQDSGILRS